LTVRLETPFGPFALPFNRKIPSSRARWGDVLNFL
jgi:hypothetical protein